LLNLKAGTDSAVIVFMASLSVSVLSAMVVGYIVSERIKNLKHMQTMTGLRLDAYWVGNFNVDFIKFVPIILVMTAGAKLLKKNHETSIYSYLVFPLSDLAFLYSASFLFNSESSA
jgi:VIT1/CCC1 family predicted Fe2+/Mn2+ transporter